jgi:hypothetical protein
MAAKKDIPPASPIFPKVAVTSMPWARSWSEKSSHSVCSCLLYLEGEVRHHHHGMGFGVQFVDLNEEQFEKLLRLLQIAKEAGPEAPAITADLVED